MIWPDGYPDESSNAAWVATGRPPLVFDPPGVTGDALVGWADYRGVGKSSRLMGSFEWKRQK